MPRDSNQLQLVGFVTFDADGSLGLNSIASRKSSRKTSRTREDFREDFQDAIESSPCDVSYSSIEKRVSE